MKRTLMGIVLGGLVGTYAAAGPELSGTPEELTAHLQSIPGEITLTGEAETKVEANRAEMVVKVTNSDRSFKNALIRNQQIRADIVATLGKSGIQQERIKMSRFSSTPTQGYFSSKVKSYEVESRVTVEVASEAELQAAAAVVDEKDGVSLLSLTFSNTDKARHETEVLNRALARVKDLKQTYEKELGVTLVPRAAGPQPGIGPGGFARPRSRAVKEVSGMSLVPEEEVLRRHAFSERRLDISQFDQVVYTATVSVVFDVIVKDGK